MNAFEYMLSTSGEPMFIPAGASVRGEVCVVGYSILALHPPNTHPNNLYSGQPPSIEMIINALMKALSFGFVQLVEVPPLMLS